MSGSGPTCPAPTAYSLSVRPSNLSSVSRLRSTRFVVGEGSAFDQKAWALCKSNNPIVQRIAAVYVTAVRQDRDRCLILPAESVGPLPDELAAVVKPDDRYLVEAQLCVAESILVTTDNRASRGVGKGWYKVNFPQGVSRRIPLTFFALSVAALCISFARSETAS